MIIENCIALKVILQLSNFWKIAIVTDGSKITNTELTLKKVFGQNSLGSSRKFRQALTGLNQPTVFPKKPSHYRVFTTVKPPISGQPE